jgi:hypothetical protein
MRHETVTTVNGWRVVLMDSISTIGPADRGCIVISGSHGGRISGAFALRHPPALAAFNDAGGGKNGAGLAALALLEGSGIPAIAISHDTARIGDAADAWAEGRISACNAPAAAARIATGMTVAEGCARFQLHIKEDQPPG